MYTNTDLKVSTYVRVDIKIIPSQFRILNRKNSRVSFAKCLFPNIQKQWNALKSSLRFQKSTNFTGE